MSTQVQTQSDNYTITRYYRDGEECVAINTSYPEQIILTKEDALRLCEDLIDFELIE